MKSTRVSRILCALTFATTAAFAQMTLSPTATPRIDAREAKQAERIQQGTTSGALTPAETARLDRGQARIQTEEAAAKADGTVTNAERAVITKSQNHQNRVIKRLKHNAATTTPSGS
jgi:uncharacterized membrane protein YebE (DUF533 family)